jgi:hypothetical protein
VRNVQPTPPWHGALRQERAQGFALDQFGEEIELPCPFADVVNREDVQLALDLVSTGCARSGGCADLAGLLPLLDQGRAGIGHRASRLVTRHHLRPAHHKGRPSHGQD